MDDSTKILSVSYGNFSCHLEGFDDSVETMKTVVSYFHDLAGHDRFMDMEPQAPDMETLARLTEEQVGAPVEIEADGNSVSMRMAADDVEDAAETVEEAIEDAGDGDTIVLKTQDDSDDPAQDDTEIATADDDASAEDDDLVDDDSVAAKLQRIRAVVSHTDDAPETAADDAADTFTEDLPEAEPAPVAVGGNPLAQRLAELAKRNAERAAEEAGIVLDLDAEDGVDAEDDDALSAEELAELDAEFDAEEEVADELADEVATLADDEELTEALDDEAVDLAVEAFEDDEIAESDVEDVAAEEPVETNDADTDEAAADTGPLVLTDATPVDTDDVPNAADAQDDIADQENARDKHSDLRDTVDANMSRILSQTDEHLAEPEGRRHRDAFAQLKAAVAATEAARQLGDAGATARDKNEVFRDDLGVLGAEEQQEKAAAEEDIVDTFADDIEAAAEEEARIEATPAEEPLTLDTPITEVQVEEAPAEDVMAEDAAPQAAPASGEAEDRDAPAAAAPAPLKLVSSQPANAEDAPLDAASARLRQIAAQKEAAPATKDGFAEFAKLHGATDLADLLEAAAAYIGFVEGEDDFSRPQVMKKVQSASDTEFSREDGLRAFGRLLRMNRLVKLSNGRFQVAEDTQYRPENKAAQG